MIAPAPKASALAKSTTSQSANRMFDETVVPAGDSTATVMSPAWKGRVSVVGVEATITPFGVGTAKLHLKSTRGPVAPGRNTNSTVSWAVTGQE